MRAGIYLEVSRATAYAGQPLQLNVSQLDENGAGHGHRIAGPKFVGSGSQLLGRVRLSPADVEALRGYLDRVSDYE